MAGRGQNGERCPSMNDAASGHAGADLEGGVLAPDRIDRAREVIREAEANDLECIRLSFADQHGLLRGKTIVTDALASAFRNGITAPSTILLKDPSHRTAFPVWSGSRKS